MPCEERVAVTGVMETHCAGASLWSFTPSHAQISPLGNQPFPTSIFQSLWLQIPALTLLGWVCEPDLAKKNTAYH